jgi:hypothetical protein
MTAVYAVLVVLLMVVFFDAARHVVLAGRIYVRASKGFDRDPNRDPGQWLSKARELPFPDAPLSDRERYSYHVSRFLGEVALFGATIVILTFA